MSDLPWDKQLSHRTTCQANYPFINAFDLRSYFFDRKGKGRICGAEGQNYNLWAPDAACDGGESLSMRYPSYGLLFLYK